jgi:hypothetical protein
MQKYNVKKQCDVFGSLSSENEEAKERETEKKAEIGDSQKLRVVDDGTSCGWRL